MTTPIRVAASAGKQIILTAVGLLSLATAGCGSHGLQPVPVRGRITLAGAAWPAAGLLYFTPVEVASGFPRRPALAKFATDGTFTVHMTDREAGLYPGKYAVAVECWEHPPSMDPNAPPRLSYVDAKFESASTSGLAVDVPVGSGPIDLQLAAEPRPK